MPLLADGQTEKDLSVGDDGIEFNLPVGFQGWRK